MKTRYLNTKAKWHPKNGLPDFQDTEDIKEVVAEFFDENGFEKIEADDLRKFYSNIRNTNKPSYWMKKSTNDEPHNWVRFGKGGKNPIFFWRLRSLPSRFSGPSYQVSPWKGDDKKFETFKEFKEYVDNYFGWS